MFMCMCTYVHEGCRCKTIRTCVCVCVCASVCACAGTQGKHKQVGDTFRCSRRFVSLRLSSFFFLFWQQLADTTASAQRVLIAESDQKHFASPIPSVWTSKNTSHPLFHLSGPPAAEPFTLSLESCCQRRADRGTTYNHEKQTAYILHHKGLG